MSGHDRSECRSGREASMVEDCMEGLAMGRDVEAEVAMDKDSVK